MGDSLRKTGKPLRLAIGTAAEADSVLHAIPGSDVDATEGTDLAILAERSGQQVRISRAGVGLHAADASYWQVSARRKQLLAAAAENR